MPTPPLERAATALAKEHDDGRITQSRALGPGFLPAVEAPKALHGRWNDSCSAEAHGPTSNHNSLVVLRNTQ